MAHRITMTVSESQSLRDIAAKLCIVQSDGQDAFQEGNKSTLVSLIATSSKQSLSEVVQLLWSIIADVDHQPRSSDVSNSTVAVNDQDLRAWELIAEQINFLINTEAAGFTQRDDVLPITPSQVLRRLAVAYSRWPNRTFGRISQVISLAEATDLKELYKKSLSVSQLKQLFAELERESQQTSDQKSWPRSPIVLPRTTTLLMLFLLTGLRDSAFDLRFKHLQMRPDGAMMIETPGEPQRQYVIYDRRFHSSFQSYLNVCGRGHWYQHLEHGPFPEPNALVWTSETDLSAKSIHNPLTRWAFYKPLIRYSQQAGIGEIYKTQLLATYASLLQEKLHDTMAIRCNLIPIGDRITDVELLLP